MRCPYISICDILQHCVVWTGPSGLTLSVADIKPLAVTAQTSDNLVPSKQRCLGAHLTPTAPTMSCAFIQNDT